MEKMDYKLIEILINQVKELKINIFNKDRFEGIEKLLKVLSDDEILYFIDKCGEDLFTNNELVDILTVNFPLIMRKYVIDFSEKYIKLADTKKEQLDKLLFDSDIPLLEYQKQIRICHIAKSQIITFRDMYLNDINNFKK